MTSCSEPARALAPRGDFAIFEHLHDGRPVVYLDSAASTPSPRSVLSREKECGELTFANVHRGKHALSMEATAVYDAARARVARFLNAEPRSIVFVGGATEAINLVARGVGLKKNDVVLTTTAEHHSNLIPWMREATVRFVASSPDAPVDPGEVRRELIRHRARVLTIHHASNVTGVVQPVRELCAIARELDVVSVVDAAQSVPHLAIDVVSIGADFLGFSAHKMLGPKGIGVLWGRPGSLEKLEPLVVGGGSIRSVGPNGFVLRPPPEGLEGGTPNVTGAVGLAAAIDYLETLGRDAVARHSRALAGTLRELLLDLPVKRLLMSREGAEIPVGSIVPREDGPSADQLALLLSDSFGVMTRSGLQCAHPLFADLGAPDGALRVSAYVYNDVADISCFAAATARLLRRFGA